MSIVLRNPGVSRRRGGKEESVASKLQMPGAINRPIDASQMERTWYSPVRLDATII